MEKPTKAQIYKTLAMVQSLSFSQLRGDGIFNEPSEDAMIWARHMTDIFYEQWDNDAFKKLEDSSN